MGRLARHFIDPFLRLRVRIASDSDRIIPGGSYGIESYEDGLNANRLGSDYTIIKKQLDKSTKLRIKLAEGGGWAARIHPKL